MFHRGQIVSALSVLCISMVSAQTATPPSSGDGSAGNPYQIASLDNLYWLTQSDTAWSEYFVQTADIDASGSSGWNAGAGFSPIGNGGTGFTGSYDGQGHVISGLSIAASSSQVGMFGSTQGGTIKNIGLLNAHVSGLAYVGALVGLNGSTVENCSSAGSVFGSAAWDGGLVGLNSNGIVRKCYSTCMVNGSVWVGGLVGGSIGSTIDNSYATGSSQGGGAGGLVGKLSYGSISNCYATGPVGSYVTGGLVGASDGFPTISNSFWDTLTTGVDTSAGGGTGESTAHMKAQATFTDAGWDFTTVWTISGSVNSGYPTLQGEVSLPVEFADFNVTAEGQSTRLNWTTATEVDNSGFDVERQEILESGTEHWSSVGFVSGSGTSTGPKRYSFVDRGLPAGLYSYRLKQKDRTGSFRYSESVQVLVGQAPKELTLARNYPNPFNPTTTIDFTIPQDGRVVLKVYDILGKEVATLLDGDRKAGEYQQVVFDASKLSSGVFFAVLRSGAKELVRKMVLMK